MKNDFPTIDRATFLTRVFEKLVRETQFEEPLEAIICGENLKLCTAFDQTLIQESWSWRNLYLAQKLAKALIDEKGEIDRKSLFSAIELLQSNLYPLGPNREQDASRRKHVLTTLKCFYDEQEFAYALKRISKPTNHYGLEQLIRHSLNLSKKIRLTDAHARQAAFAALLVSLRQNVGSCFATAPAILIQQTQPLQFLADISQLFGIGALKRVVAGVEYLVPLSATTGSGNLYLPFFVGQLGKEPWKKLGRAPGVIAACKAARIDPKQLQDVLEPFVDKPFTVLNFAQILSKLTSSEEAKTAFKAMTDNPLLKAWEFTLASFAEVKADFTKWNLYASLGIEPSEPYGIGENVQREIQKRIDIQNEKLEEYQSRYDHTFAHVKSLEGRVQRSSAEREVGWLHAEYQMQRHALNRIISEREEIYERGRRIGSLYPFLVRFYIEKFPEYFQEVYDAQLHEIAELYNDSPAGFRLLYKHGRKSTHLWTWIHNEDDYLKALSAFFIATEVELAQQDEVKGLQVELTALVTAIVTTIKDPMFIKSSFERLARSHGEQRSSRKPWAYISGGTMETLVSYYYSSGEEPKKVSRWIENEMELLVFLLDTLKELPLSVQRHFEDQKEQALLAHSPTHAFLVKPGWEPFREGWDNDAYTYSWVRDYWIEPMHAFIDRHRLDKQMQDVVIKKLIEKIPEGYQPIVKQSLGESVGKLTTYAFRGRIASSLSYERWLQQGSGYTQLMQQLDGILYYSIPFFPEHELRTHLERLFDSMEEIDNTIAKKIFDQFDTLEVRPQVILSAQDLRRIATALVMQVIGKIHSHIAYPQRIWQQMQKLGLAFPAPILFADTNWVHKRFGFIVNPGTDLLELWTFDALTLEGEPLTLWKPYLDGTSKKKWGLYTAPKEYGSQARVG